MDIRRPESFELWLERERILVSCYREHLETALFELLLRNITLSILIKCSFGILTNLGSSLSLSNLTRLMNSD